MTNSAAPILRTFAATLAGFEVASGGEVAKARAVSVELPVIFDGPAKTPEEIRYAIKANIARFYAESRTELTRLSAAAVDLGCTVKVLLRIKLAGPFPEATPPMAGRPTQFGIEESRVAAAVELASTLPGLRLVADPTWSARQFRLFGFWQRGTSG